MKTAAQAFLTFLAALLLALLAAVLGFLLATPAQAATLGLHTVSWHDQPRADGRPFESRTPGLYLRRPDGATAGLLRNSLGRWGGYAGWTWSSDEARPLGLAFTAALISGYPAAPLVPLLAPSLRVRLGERAALRLIVIPQWHPKQGASVASAALEWSLP